MLTIEHVSKTFCHSVGGRRPALENLNVTVNSGEIVALVGASGCGKSTLLRMLAGLEHSSSGRIHLANDLISSPTIRRSHPDIAMVFQEPRLLPWLNVRENLRLVLRQLPEHLQESRIEQALRQVNLWDFQTALPKQLSGGMAQRAAIARALVREPQIMLLDEPFSALDSFTRAHLQHHLIKIWQQRQLTLVVVTHDLDEAVRLAHRVIVLQKPDNESAGEIKHSLAIEIPHPRHANDSSLLVLKQRVLEVLV